MMLRQMVLDSVGIRSLDFVPDGAARLVDKDGREVHRAQIKLTDEFDGLSLLLARIEKACSSSQSASEFWTKACDILVRSQVPSIKEASSEIYRVYRGSWLELACFWIAFLAKVRHEKGLSGWDNLLSGDQLIFRFIDFYNKSPSRGPELREPAYEADRVHLQALLDAVRKATNNQVKKETLETLAEHLTQRSYGI